MRQPWAKAGGYRYYAPPGRKGQTNINKDINMNHKQLFITVSCLLLFAASGKAQQPAEPTQDELLRMQMEALEPHFQQSFLEGLIRQRWDNQGISHEVLGALGDPVVRASWGISEEQNKQMEALGPAALERMQDSIPESFVLRVLTSEETGEVTVSLALTDFNITPAEMKAAAEQITALMMNATVDALNEVLTPAQWQKINESQLANIAETPMFSPNIFEALGLTDVQRQQMEQIKKALEPEFEQTLENWVNGELTLIDKELDALKKDENRTSASATETRKKLMAEAPEFRRIYEDIQAQGKAFSTRFKIAMFDVLTDEQWFRLQNLIDNPPEHALVFRRVLREQRGESEDAEEASGVWMPGPNSWRPGDAIPEAYRIERNTRRQFPRGEE